MLAGIENENKEAEVRRKLQVICNLSEDLGGHDEIIFERQTSEVNVGIEWQTRSFAREALTKLVLKNCGVTDGRALISVFLSVFFLL